MTIKVFFTSFFLAIITNAFSQSGTVTFKNGEKKQGVITCKRSKIFLYLNAEKEATEFFHKDIEYMKIGEIEFYRSSPKSNRLERFSVIIDGETKFLSQTLNTIHQNNNNSNTRIIKYFIKKKDMNYAKKVYRVIVGDINYIGYKKKVKNLFSDCSSLIQKMKNGDFKKNKKSKDEQIAEIVTYYNENCGK